MVSNMHSKFNTSSQLAHSDASTEMTSSEIGPIGKKPKEERRSLPTIDLSEIPSQMGNEQEMTQASNNLAGNSQSSVEVNVARAEKSSSTTEASGEAQSEQAPGTHSVLKGAEFSASEGR